MKSIGENGKIETVGNFSKRKDYCQDYNLGKAKRATIDNLLSPKATVRKAQANNEQVLSILSGMEKAYDLT